MPLAGDGWQWLIYIVKFWMRDPPGGPNSFNFMQFLRKFGKNLMLVPPLESWRPLIGQILDPPLGGVLIQWQIKDFPEGGAPKVGVLTYFFGLKTA